MTERLVGGRYRLGARIGVGGMGRVWRAYDEVLRREVAVKEVLLPETPSEDEAYELSMRTLREAQAAARLAHSNVVRVYDVMYADDRPWIVMEYVPSRSLAQVIKADGPMRPEQVALVGVAVLDALSAAHAAGVLHRDIKPGNVLLADDGRVVLTDFGLATFEEIGVALTQSGIVHGSPQYIAPERALDGTSSIEADMWSLGATLYAAVEGQSPYARPTSYQTLAALATAPPDQPKRAGPLKPVLAGLLRRKPSSRMKAPEVRARLQRIASGEAGRRFPRPRRAGAGEDTTPSTGMSRGLVSAVPDTNAAMQTGPAAANLIRSSDRPGSVIDQPAVTPEQSSPEPATSMPAVPAVSPESKPREADDKPIGRHHRDDAGPIVAGELSERRAGGAPDDVVDIGAEYRRGAPPIEWRHPDGGIVVGSSDSGSSDSGSSDSGSSDTKQELEPPKERRPWRLAAIAAVIVLLAGGGYVAQRQLNGDHRTAHPPASAGSTSAPGAVATPSGSPGVPFLANVPWPCSQLPPADAEALQLTQSTFRGLGVSENWTWFPFTPDFPIGLPVGWLMARSKSTACLYDQTRRPDMIAINVSIPTRAQVTDPVALLSDYVSSVLRSSGVSGLQVVGHILRDGSIGPLQTASVTYQFNGAAGKLFTWARVYVETGRAYLVAYTTDAASKDTDESIWKAIQSSIVGANMPG